MSAKNDNRTNEQKREAAAELWRDPVWCKRAINWVAKQAGVSYDVAADERRKLGLEMNVKLEGEDGKRRLCGEGRVRRDRAPLSGESTKPLLTFYDAVVGQLNSGSLDSDELKRLAAKAAPAARYHRKILERCSRKRRRTE